jgi:hypothetical protein
VLDERADDMKFFAERVDKDLHHPPDRARRTKFRA